MMEKVKFLNICMIYDNEGNVVVQDRISDKWPGLTFPGGHVDNGEAFTDAVIREVWEETGLTVSNLQLCGIQDSIQDDGTRYMVLFYKTNTFAGKLVSSNEGKVFWAKLSELPNMKLSRGFLQMLRLFLEDNLSEQFFYKESDKWIEVFK